MKKSVEGKSGNVIISPVSIHSVLTMALFGAPGGTITRSQMIKGLKYRPGIKNDKIAETFEKLSQKVGENDDGKIGKNCIMFSFLN